MAQENKSYRIRTKVGCSEEPVVHVDMTQSFDKFEILSLTLDQTNNYTKLSSDYGIIVGRVLANGGFGIPNAKISVFVKYEDTEDIYKRILYNYNSTKSKDNDGVRYNLLPKELNDECHQNIGTFPTKRMVLDNDTWIDIFDKYYKYTTKTNNAGDYMIYGVPVGNQTVHVDIDMSDIGVLSQRPRDMIYKGANINQFESPNKFRTDTNLDYLAQVFTQDKVTYVYPFWGDTTENELGAAITRCDIDIDYRFEPTCIFMGSVMTDTGENSLSKKCVGQKNQGKMSEMITGQGTVEMIRKTPEGFIEQYSVMGNQLIDTDGVWCYQIPMNLDYIITDEYGNTVLSDDPNKGIATRARVRFRIGMSDTGTEGTARKRAKYLVPNNPRFVEEDYPKFCASGGVIDYEFGSKTREEDFRDIFWNKVYTVKSYIPRLQKSRLPNNKKRTGIKMVNHSGSNNPMPFNGLGIKFNFTYMFLCALLKVLVWVVAAINTVLTALAKILYDIGETIWTIGNNLANWCITDDSLGISWLAEFSWCPFETIGGWFKDVGCWFENAAVDSIGNGIILQGLCVDDDGNDPEYNPGVIPDWESEKYGCYGKKKLKANTDVSTLFNCVENQLAQENEVTSFNFENDWINGVLYMPLWYRKIKPKKKYFFGLITVNAKDQWCNSDNRIVKSKKLKKHLKLYRTCAQEMKFNSKTASNPMGSIKPLGSSEYVSSASRNKRTGIETIRFSRHNDTNCYGFDCHNSSRTYLPIDKGLIVKKETMLGDEVYYYKPTEFNDDYNKDLVTLFATDLVLLGSLNDCDMNGIPQFFKALESTTYNMPPDLLLEDYEYNDTIKPDSEDSSSIQLFSRNTENTGADWGNIGVDQSIDKNQQNTNLYDNGGLFYGLTCFNSYTKPKSCINLSRICEFGVSVDEAQFILNSQSANASNMTNEDSFEDLHETLTPDGYISYDEIYDMDYRSMFATLNGNFLKTKLNFETGLYEYDFNHLYVDNFDGVLSNIMGSTTVNKTTEISNWVDKANYRNNYRLEKNSNDYLDFRFGNYSKKNNKKIYYYDFSKQVASRYGSAVNATNRFPRFENSFYFYFGLNEGKTAIDKFRTNFFADCTNDGKASAQYQINFVPNGWCDSQDGYITFETNLPLPIKLQITRKNAENLISSVYTVDNITNDNFYIGHQTSEVSKNYKHYHMICENTETDYLINGEYIIQIVDGEENVIEENITFKDKLLEYSVDAHSFALKNDDLEYIPSIQQQVHDGNGNLIWGELFKLVANYSQPSNVVSVSNYDIANRNIGGYIAVDIHNLEDGYYKTLIKPVNTKTFGSDYYKVNGQNRNILILNETKDIAEYGTIAHSEQFEPNKYYIYNETTGEYEITQEYIDDETIYYIYAYLLTYNSQEIVNEETAIVPKTFAYFTGNDNEFVFEENRINPNNWELIPNEVGTLDIVTNYRGCDFILSKTDNLIEIISGYDNKDIGYLGYNQDLETLYFGVPYGGERYSLVITQLCNEDNQYIETENSVITTIMIPEFDFKMFINGVDYDLIKNFRTGFDEKPENTVAVFNANVAPTVWNDSQNQWVYGDPSFNSSNIYGWNDLDNIGKIRQSNLVATTYNVITPINYLNPTTTETGFRNLRDKIKKYLDVLNYNFEWNGVKHYVRFIVNNNIDPVTPDIPDDPYEPIVPVLPDGRDSLATPNIRDGAKGGTRGVSFTTVTIDISTPYTWTIDYCMSPEDVDEYKRTLDNAHNTVVRNIKIIEIEFVQKDLLLPFEVDVEYYYYDTDTELYYGPYDNTQIDPSETRDWYYVKNKNTNEYEEEINTVDVGSIIKKDKWFNNQFNINNYDENDGYEIVYGSHNRNIIFTDFNEGNKTIKLNGQQVTVYEIEPNYYYYNSILAVMKDTNNTYIYQTYVNDLTNHCTNGYEVSVYYYEYSSNFDKILDIIYDVNDIIVKRQEVAKQMQASFRKLNENNFIQITYKSNEPPIKYNCIGSTEVDTNAGYVILNNN